MSTNVLIMDQDTKLAKLYCRFLVDQGLSAEVAACGFDCVRMVRERVPDVLVLDRELRWNGAGRILAGLRQEGIGLPVILTTWNTSVASVQRLVEPPVVACLRKFFPLPVLLHAIQAAVGNDAIDTNWDGERFGFYPNGDPVNAEA